MSNVRLLLGSSMTNRLSSFIALAVASLGANAQDLVAYYQIGGDPVPWVRWDTYVVDVSSIVREGDSIIRYKHFRITSQGSDPAEEVRANCQSRRRGLASDTSMYSTYDGALTGEEVKVACSSARAKGLIKG